MAIFENSTVDKDLYCQICFRVMRDPVQTPCHHSFCRICLQCHLRNSELCAQDKCNEVIDVEKLAPASLLVNRISQLIVPCHCQTPVKFGVEGKDFHHHLSHCRVHPSGQLLWQDSKIYTRVPNHMKDAYVDYAKRHGVDVAALRLVPRVSPRTIERWSQGIHNSHPPPNYKNHPGAGRRPALPPEAEHTLFSMVVDQIYGNVPWDRAELKEQALKLWSILKQSKSTPTKPRIRRTFVASNRWISGFLRRYGFSMHIPSPIATSAGDGADPRPIPDRIQQFWMEAWATRTKFHINPRFILSNDEIRIPFSFKPKRRIGFVGQEHVRVLDMVAPKGGGCSLLVTGTAAGQFLAPLLVFKGKGSGRMKTRLPPNLDKKPVLVGYAPKSFVDQHVYADTYLEKIVKPYLAKQRTELGCNEQPALLYADAAPAHLGAKVIPASVQCKLHTMSIPDKCTPFVQVMDVAVFRPLRTHVNNLLAKELRKFVLAKKKMAEADWRSVALAVAQEALYTINADILVRAHQACGLVDVESYAAAVHVNVDGINGLHPDIAKWPDPTVLATMPCPCSICAITTKSAEIKTAITSDPPQSTSSSTEVSISASSSSPASSTTSLSDGHKPRGPPEYYQPSQTVSVTSTAPDPSVRGYDYSHFAKISDSSKKKGKRGKKRARSPVPDSKAEQQQTTSHQPTDDVDDPPDVDYPPAIGTFVAYEHFVPTSPRAWQLGKVSSCHMTPRRVTVELYGCKIGRKTNLITAPYFKAKYKPETAKSPGCWLFDDSQEADTLEIDWGSVFVLDMQLEKHKIDKDGQKGIEDHLSSCKMCQDFSKTASTR